MLVSSSDGLEDIWVVVLSAVGLTGAEIWAFNRNAKLEVALREGPLALCTYTALAFVAWAIGTSQNLRGVIELSQQKAVLVMAAVAFLLPAVSEAIARHRTGGR